MSNQLFSAFIKYLMRMTYYNELNIHTLAMIAREDINDQDTIEQQALNYFIGQYDSIKGDI